MLAVTVRDTDAVLETPDEDGVTEADAVPVPVEIRVRDGVAVFEGEADDVIVTVMADDADRVSVPLDDGLVEVEALAVLVGNIVASGEEDGDEVTAEV